MNTIQVVLIILMFSACNSGQEKNNLHPMVDGRNTEWSQLDVEPIKVVEGVRLYVFQNASYVWIAYDFPKGSYGTLDMIIKTDKLEKPLNIHVSAQLGEWLLGDEENIPKTATSELWWNHKGWIANNLWVNGIDTISYDTPDFKLINGDIREIQLSKERFGSGEWKVQLKINAIKNSQGQYDTIIYPEDDEYYSIFVKD